MQPPAPFCILLTALWLAVVPAAHADAPATEFFAMDTAKLIKLAPTDDKLETLTSAQISALSIAHGWYGGGLAMTFTTSTFRMDARFDGMAGISKEAPASIHYRINASNDPAVWSLLSVQGSASRQGRQFITEDWRKQPVTVILRYLDLKR